MTAAHIDVEHASQDFGTRSFDRRGARMRAKTDTELTVISISGEIDASNAYELSHRASELASDCGALIFDLADIGFIGLDGLYALFALNIQCVRTGTTWAVIASRAVNRLLRVADHDKLIPAVGSATEALLLVLRSSRSHQSLQLVSPPRPA
jgi:anti-anti-sigma factor